MKKVVCLILAIIMVLGLSATALAEPIRYHSWRDGNSIYILVPVSRLPDPVVWDNVQFNGVVRAMMVLWDILGDSAAFNALPQYIRNNFYGPDDVPAYECI